MIWICVKYDVFDFFYDCDEFIYQSILENVKWNICVISYHYKHETVDNRLPELS